MRYFDNCSSVMLPQRGLLHNLVPEGDLQYIYRLSSEKQTIPTVIYLVIRNIGVGSLARFQLTEVAAVVTLISTPDDPAKQSFRTV